MILMISMIILLNKNNKITVLLFKMITNLMDKEDYKKNLNLMFKHIIKIDGLFKERIYKFIL
jgi:hypothetical protein